MEQQRLAPANDDIVVTFRWNRNRNAYEMHRHRRGENQPPLLTSEDWDMRYYYRDGVLIFQENNNNQSRISSWVRSDSVAQPVLSCLSSRLHYEVAQYVWKLPIVS
ncbi:hypothetical protein TSUD_280600 [Trifolium subterraneum]|uniref:Uncharacterized protein n=1 Tax=Trifolium subterraneum TaxID=3900 RepID=A0A2Z6PIV6_TRISU|nr:hypothetical protein TSUD_280600 [Trifolium subterraneum]